MDTITKTDIAAQLAVEYPSLESIALRTGRGMVSNAVFCTVTHDINGVPWRVSGREWFVTSSGTLDNKRFSRDLIPCSHGSVSMLEEDEVAGTVTVKDVYAP